MLLQGSGRAEPGTRDGSLGGDGGLRGLGVIGSNPARTRPQLLRRALHPGCHPLPAGGWRCRHFLHYSVFLGQSSARSELGAHKGSRLAGHSQGSCPVNSKWSFPPAGKLLRTMYYKDKLTLE